MWSWKIWKMERSLNPFNSLEREKGIEPSFLAWEASVLPLNHSRLRIPLYSNPRARQLNRARGHRSSDRLRREIEGQFAGRAQVELARAEMRELLDEVELIGARNPQIWQAGFTKPREHLFELLFAEPVQHDELFAFLRVRNSGYYKGRLRRAG